MTMSDLTPTYPDPIPRTLEAQRAELDALVSDLTDELVKLRADRDKLNVRIKEVDQRLTLARRGARALDPTPRRQRKPKP